MNTTNELRADLNFVAAAVRRNRSLGVPAILLLWAVLIPIGFALADFASPYAGPFWLVAGPLGGVVSAVLGHAAGRSAGLMDRSLGRRHGLHWLTLGVAYLLFASSLLTGQMDSATSAPIWLLLTAVAYTTAGIHLEDSSGMLPAGLLMFAGYAALEWLPLPYPWTLTGLIVSASLVIAAVGASRNAARA